MTTATILFIESNDEHDVKTKHKRIHIRKLFRKHLWISYMDQNAETGSLQKITSI